MTAFPTLTPSARTFTPGDRAHAMLRSMGGRSTQVRHSNVITGQRVALQFLRLTEAQMLSIQAHYINRRGQFYTFSLPSAIWAGVTDPTVSGYSWRYVAVPEVEDIPWPRSLGIGSWYDVTVDLEMVAEYAPPASTGDTILRVPAGRVAVAALAPQLFGSPSIDVPVVAITLAGLVPTVYSGPAGSVAVPAAAITVAALAPTFAIVPVPAAAITIAALAPLATGAVVDVPVVEIAVAALAPAVQGAQIVSVPAGAITVAALAPSVQGSALVDIPAAAITVAAAVPAIEGDPPPVAPQLLLHFNGTDGSTTITDSSGNSYTCTANGSAELSTLGAEVKFGSAALDLGASSGYVDVTGDSGLTFPGEFTIDFWARRGAGNCWIELGTYVDGILLRDGDVNYVQNTSTGTAVNTSASTYQHIAITRDSSNDVRVFRDGSVLSTTTISGTINSTGADLRIGAYRHTSGGYMIGQVDELRVIKGTAVWTAAFTPPSSAYPDP